MKAAILIIQNTDIWRKVRFQRLKSEELINNNKICFFTEISEAQGMGAKIDCFQEWRLFRKYELLQMTEIKHRLLWLLLYSNYTDSRVLLIGA